MVPEDDPLARTATAPGSEPDAATSSPIGETLGRYRLQRELGAGGMGVVHAALDPDLERRVALKVLRGTDSPEARQRLLREARAMAKVTHPNVVTVHEVGSASGRDYVAMELIDGGTLEDWLRAERRATREIINAFMAAGRGLVAAHAAGLVHRDFKPRNVLRHKSGRIVVTDFGLVLGIEADGSLETTMRASQPTVAGDSSSLSGLTATGSLLGTPAYMAPEQWNGAAVGPPADQFAFCVALWEALAGERPFRGDTFDELKASIEKGPGALDDTKIPRRLRSVLRQGLDPDPKRRWPSMNDLLAAISRSERGPGLVLAIAGAAIVAGGLIFWLVGRSDDGPTCEAPSMNPALVWPSPPPSAAAGQKLAVAAIDRDLATWREVRERTCKLDEATRQVRLACLDSVLVRIDATARVLAAVGGEKRLPIDEQLVDPALCELPRPPRLMRSVSPELLEMMTATARWSVMEDRLTEAEAMKLVERAAKEPCAAATARVIVAGARETPAARNADLEEAEREAQRCGDDRLLADLMLVAASAAISDNPLDVQNRAKLRRAEAAVEAVKQHDLEADLELLRAHVAYVGDDIDEALLRVDSASKHYNLRGRPAAAISAALETITYAQMRARPEDLAMIAPRLAALRAEAATLVAPDDNLLVAVDSTAAGWQFASGDVAGAHAKLVALHRERPVKKPRRVVGRVVDELGKPVAGATVAAAPFMYGDTIAPWFPSAQMRTTVTGADGRFTIAEAASDGVLLAHLDSRRSSPLAVADDVTLTLGPTSRIEGTVDLQGEPPTKVTIMLRDPAQDPTLPYWGLRAPVKPDGTFSVDGVPRGRVLVQTHVGRSTTSVIAGQQITVDEPVETVKMVLTATKRVVHVIVRSTVSQPFTNGQAFVIQGHVQSTNLEEMYTKLAGVNINVKGLRPIIGENAPPAVLGKARTGDLYATIPEVPVGPVSACGVGLPPIEVIDEKLGKKLELPENRVRVLIPCVKLGPTDDVVIVEVPPWPRFD